MKDKRKSTIKTKGDWKQVPMTKAQALKILANGLPQGTKVSIDLGKDSQKIDLMVKGIFSDSRTFDIEKGALEAGSMEVESKHQGRGIGRNIMRNVIEFFYLCGVRSFNIYAALSAGGYTWARQGFLPDNVHDHGFQEIKKNIRQRYQSIRSYLTKKDQDLLDKAIKFKNEKDIWTIADMQRAVTSDLKNTLKHAFNDAAKKRAPEQKSLRKAFMNLTWGKDALSYICARIDNGQKVPVGMLLLAGTDWHGHLDMNDKEQMARVRAYVGGWHFIKPKY